MLPMILKMTAVTMLSVLLTMLVWIRTQGKEMTAARKTAIGLVYGLFAVLSTHFGVDYSHMMLNVRDLGPLSAGLFFDPVSGIIAGLIGGIERYIAGTFWGIGSYTRIACSISTCLAGFVAAAMNLYLFKRKKPSAVYAFFMGAVMEVFHMYVVFITHRNDMNMAFYVVKTCAPPMIIFTGLGLGLSSVSLKIYTKEWKNPLHVSKEDIPVSSRFQFWLFAVTFAILISNQVFSFVMQTQTAEQNAAQTLTDVSGDIHLTYDKLKQNEANTNALAEETARMEALAIAGSIDYAGGLGNVRDDYLENMRNAYNLVSVTTVDTDGNVTAQAGDSPFYGSLLSDVQNGSTDSKAVSPSDVRIAAGARCKDGIVQVVIDKNSLTSALNLSSLNESLSFFHVGNAGTFDIIRDSGVIMVGDHQGSYLDSKDRKTIDQQERGVCFRAKLFGKDSLCRLEELNQLVTLLTCIPMSDVYAGRDAQAYESAFAAIILFAVIYVLISMLVQGIVVNNLELINASLSRITQGDLDEVVSVRNSSEFASLSNDINQTVSALKGYIDAAEKRIEQELEFAHTIQNSALPKNFNFPRRDFEVYATMDPAKEVGGDFYDFFFIDHDKLVLVIADVSGKGIPAALFMMRAKTAIRGLAETGQSPSEILYRANNALCEGNDAEMFVTVWLGIIDLSTGKMQCASAGHEYPVLMRANMSYDYVRDKHGLVLAAMEGMKFKEYELDFHPGDKLFIYTDGIPEALNTEVEQYGPDRLLAVLNKVRNKPMTETLPAVRKDIADFAAGADQFDDITMMGFLYNGPEAQKTVQAE